METIFLFLSLTGFKYNLTNDNMTDKHLRLFSKISLTGSGLIEDTTLCVCYSSAREKKWENKKKGKEKNGPLAPFWSISGRLLGAFLDQKSIRERPRSDF